MAREPINFDPDEDDDDRDMIEALWQDILDEPDHRARMTSYRTDIDAARIDKQKRKRKAARAARKRR